MHITMNCVNLVPEGDNKIKISENTNNYRVMEIKQISFFLESRNRLTRGKTIYTGRVLNESFSNSSESV